MTVRAITFDFWSTLFRDAHGEARWAARTRTAAALTGADAAMVENHLKDISRGFYEHHIRHQRTLGPEDAVGMLCERLGCTLSAAQTAELCHVLGTSILDHAPEPEPDALEAVAAAAARVPVGLISDAGFSPGASLRVLLARHGFDRYFRTMVFSDEVGASKPQPVTFQTAAAALGVAPHEIFHIGDLEPTDIAGIRQLGGTAGLFAGINARFLGATAAEYTFLTWKEFIEALPEIC